MKALSIKQPWGYLIAAGIKNIENRKWKTNYRGKFYIHVSAKSAGNLPMILTGDQASFITCNVDKMPPEVKNMNFSAIIGEVELIDCVINHKSIWAEANWPDEKPIYNWVLANAVLYEKPILNVKGKLSFWQPDFGICPKCKSTNITTWEPGHHQCSDCYCEFGN